MRIVSRLNESEVQLQRIRNILEAVSDGAVSDTGSIEPGKDLSTLVGQVDEAFCILLTHIDTIEEDYEALQSECLALSVQCAEQEKIIDCVTEGIPYDEALDHATLDLMDALLSSGAANTTFDGDLSFEEDVTFSREDLKPMLRQAIDTWVRMKVR